MTLILFMNKCHLLAKKIKNGVCVKKPLMSFRRLRQCSPPVGTLYIIPTSVTDTQASGISLQTVRGVILREHLRHSNLV
ncbi:hypothetical protein PILCRDRAFT_811851 [Piloderma croceum F 1598]|uniref:Uncharacterized protein n=1 Tax=Piloderma croceum (strain F 1598) TaxID=765440 RepID=A0A0C3CKD6_PILCF|nr:hypothetical protein PILCRDRAFT_811851 [Piloderma croceum F 1598]